MKDNQAKVDALSKVQISQSDAYSKLKETLKLTNSQLLSFMKNKLIKNYDGHDMALNIVTPEKIES